ncbi:hypothetical protein BU17DRAFT_54104 [Hysterangium stoloniferum]|nr:hypothetical protein BU17DRAFT_54104 [Hysterangium stoloniferum]
MSTDESSEGLLLVLADPGPDITLEEYNDWYDNEHAPLRLTVEGFQTALRYKANDTAQPGWLALYDLTDPDVITSDAYKAINLNQSQRENDIIAKSKMLNRRVYSHISTQTSPRLSPSALPAKYVLIVSVDAKPEDEADLNKWYAVEHMDAISKVPGWLRGRRYKLVSTKELAGQADKDTPPATKYLSVHEWDRPDYRSTKEFKEMYDTPWSVQVSNYLTRREPRTFELYKDFGKPR